MRKLVVRRLALGVLTLFLISLVVLGFVMSYQVQRVRALSRYYEGRSGT